MSSVLELPKTDKPQLTLSLLEQLLQDQQSLSAVEMFSEWHTKHENNQPTYKALLPATTPAAGQQYAFEVNLDTCSGCKACVVACHNLNGLETEETWRKVGTLTNSRSQLPIVQYVTTACHHCTEPGCLSGCPVKAYEKDEVTGIVKHLDDQCFGCQYCTMMCPYEVPQYSSTLGIVRKCDMCSQRLQLGEAPACVQACPNQAIRITLVDIEPTSTVTTIESSALVPTAPPSDWTKPTTRFLSTKHKHVDLDSVESLHDELHHAHWPLVWMLVLTQTSVGMWFYLAATKNLSNPWSIVDSSIAVVATLIGVVGVHAALLHLGRPMLAFRAFLGWRTSWLSREAILFGVFMGLCGATICSSYFAASTPYLTNLLRLAIAAIGVAAAASSAMIYIATKRSLWNLPRTMTDFFGTVIGLGFAFTSLTLASININSHWMLIMACCASLISFLPKAMDWYRGSISNATRPLTPLLRRRGERNEVIEVVIRQERRSAREAFSFRSGQLMQREAASIWIASVSLLAIAFTSSLISIVVPSFYTAAVTSLSLLIAHLMNRSLYFSTIVTYRMPGASS